MNNETIDDKEENKCCKNICCQLHCDGDLPAIELTNGDNMCLHEGKLHRDGNKPAVEIPDQEPCFMCD